MRPLALALLLAACSSKTADLGTTSTGDTSAQAGTGGQGGTGGEGGDGTTTATTGTSTVTTASASTGGGEGGVGGQGGATAATTGAGGEGGTGGETPWEPACEPSSCPANGLYCADCDGFAHSCEDHVCTDSGGSVPLAMGVGQLGVVWPLRVPRIDPSMTHPNCESVCDGDAAWAVRIALPDVDGCVAVDAPSGWYAATRPLVGGQPPRACPVASANQEACARMAYGPDDHLVVWLREGEGTQEATIWLTATAEACPAEPVDCGPATCNGEEP